jgi:hypothetical protein
MVYGVNPKHIILKLPGNNIAHLKCVVLAANGHTCKCGQQPTCLVFAGDTYYLELAAVHVLIKNVCGVVIPTGVELYPDQGEFTLTYAGMFCQPSVAPELVAAVLGLPMAFASPGDEDQQP